MKKAMELFAEAQQELEMEYRAEKNNWEKMYEAA
jgi:hypothetical protein